MYIVIGWLHAVRAELGVGWIRSTHCSVVLVPEDFHVPIVCRRNQRSLLQPRRHPRVSAGFLGDSRRPVLGQATPAGVHGVEGLGCKPL